MTPAPLGTTRWFAGLGHSATLIRVIVAGAAVILAAVCGFAQHFVAQERQEAFANFQATNSKIALSDEVRIRSLLASLDKVMLVLRKDFKQNPRLTREALLSRLEELKVDNELSPRLSFVSASGDVLLASALVDGRPIAQLNVADRAYFQQQKAARDDQLQVGAPIQSRVTGQWVVPLTRRISQPDGSFGGVLILSVNPDLFTEPFAGTSLGPGATRAILGRDGYTLLRLNAGKIEFGGDTRKSQLYREIERAPVGCYTAVAASDGVQRAVCYRVVDPYAIIILAGSAVRDIEESYTATVRSYVLSASLLGVLVVLLSALLIVGVLRQKQLLESQQSFNQLIELVPQLIARLDAQGRVVWANRRTLAFVGPSAEAQSQGFDWVQAAIHPDDLARVQAFVGKALAMVDCTESCEYRKRRFDAAYLWHASQITRVRDPRGEGDTFLQTDTDIHDRRMADERARVTQRLESIGQLTGGMAHDFNNLLAIVVGNLDLVMSHLPADEDSKRLQVARDAAQRGVGLVKSLLALASKQPLLPSVIDLTELLQRIAPLLRHAVGQRVRLELDVPEQALAVKVDEAGLEAALLNLTVNARDAMPHGGELAIRTHSLDGMVRIAVQDNGVGMSEAVVRRATEPFFTTKLQGHGTGLGLSMVAGFVKQSGGNFSIQSREGAGTTVEISLPQLAAADVVDRTQPAPLRLTHIQGAGPWRVLVVDDEPEVASLLREWLREDGHTAVLTSSAKDALELLSVRSFDILLTDIIMPGALDGIQLAERAQALYPAMKILLMSGYSRETATARTDVPWPLLVKPFHKADFATALKQAPEAAL